MDQPAQPVRNRIYKGFISDTRIWADFALRPDDIVISTPPKSGTTWMQTIVAMLIHGRDAANADVRELSPWLDCAFRDPPAQAAKLAAQAHRRAIKSHAPLDGIAWDPQVTYIAVYRHPMDAHFSMRRHVGNTNPGFMPDLAARFPEDIVRGFEMFVEEEAEDTGTDRMTLDGLVGHYLSFRAWAHLPNVHLFHYATMTRDLPGTVARLAKLLDIERSPDDLGAIAEAASFGSMKATAKAQFAGTTDTVFKDRAAFFDSATSGKWQGRVPEALVHGYRARIRALLEPADIAWIETGTG